ncbi:MAG: DUF4160 domain-containing protein [Kiritimatiellaeota bacterium]|nr:DUF4160 domain-containing protein [Kiritimatiellota bacterium]
MPVISMFYGISIYINFSEHNPPHFHAWHAGRKGTFSIKTGELLNGEMSQRDTKLIAAWAELYRKELMLNWNIARKHGVLIPIKPL